MHKRTPFVNIANDTEVKRKSKLLTGDNSVSEELYHKESLMKEEDYS